MNIIHQGMSVMVFMAINIVIGTNVQNVEKKSFVIKMAEFGIVVLSMTGLLIVQNAVIHIFKNESLIVGYAMRTLQQYALHTFQLKPLVFSFLTRFLSL